MNEASVTTRTLPRSSRHLVRNEARCLECNTTITSTSRHDMKTCACGALSVDGGLAYTRRLFHKDGRWEELSRYADGPAPGPGTAQLEHSDLTLTGVHSPLVCANPQRCTLHHRTEHSLRRFEQVWAYGIMWRHCDHGVLHPDPDEIGVLDDHDHPCCGAECCRDAYDEQPTSAVTTPTSVAEPK